MKKNLLLLIVLFVGAGTFAQGNSQGKAKGKSKHDNTVVVTNPPVDVNDGKVKSKSNGKGKVKYSKNTPTRVAEAFHRDYPGAVNPVWTKSRGNWTVTFGNGLFRSTATYHANGDRRDTQTPIVVKQAPRSIFDAILKRYPRTNTDRELVRIERPGQTPVYKWINTDPGNAITLLFDENGSILP